MINGARVLLGGLAIASAAALTGCGDKPANASDLLVVTPNPNIQVKADLGGQPPVDCKTKPDPAQSHVVSNLTFAGPCAFTEHTVLTCVNKIDDYYVYVSRDLTDGARVGAVINVEKYKGPGKYTHNATIYVQLIRNGTLYEWMDQSGTLSVINDGYKVILPPNKLPAVAGSLARGAETISGVAVCKHESTGGSH